MKKACIAILIITASYLMADMGAVNLSSSNQSITTSGFEKNEYDYFLNPFLMGNLENPWVVGSFNTTSDLTFGWATGMENNLNFILTFASNSTLNPTSDSTVANDNLAYTDSSNENTKDSDITNDLKLHFGFTTKKNMGLILQFLLDNNYINSENSTFSDSYDANGTLTIKGNLTKTKTSLLNDKNAYALDMGTGLFAGDKEISLNLGLEFNNFINRIDSTIVTSFNEAVSSQPNNDSTLRDRQTTTKVTGQLDDTGASTLGYNTNSTGTSFLTNTAVSIASTTKWKDSQNINYVIPLNISTAFYNNLESVDTSETLRYIDTTGVVFRNDTTTIKDTLSIPFNFDISTGFGLDKSFEAASKANFYLGGETNIGFGILKEEKGEVTTTITKNDTNQDGTFETDTLDETTENGIEITSSNGYVSINGQLGASYSPINLITFHASAIPYVILYINMIKTVENSGNVNVYTDNVTAANTATTDTKGLTITDESTDVSSTAGTSANFGFTLNISDNFKIDAKSNWNGLSFDTFSLMALFSY